jgi:hypothetical protein
MAKNRAIAQAVTVIEKKTAMRSIRVLFMAMHFIRNYRQDTRGRSASGVHLSPVLLVSLVSLFDVGLRSIYVLYESFEF